METKIKIDPSINSIEDLTHSAEHMKFFLHSKSYEEYLMQCNLENIAISITEEEFDELKKGEINLDFLIESI